MADHTTSDRLGKKLGNGLTKAEMRDLVELTARSDRAGLARLASHIALIVATGLIVWTGQQENWWLLVPAMALHGIALIFLFAPLHESIHQTPFRTRWINDAVAAACGAILLLPSRYFRAFHLAHHRHTQDPDKDPELARPKPATVGQFLWHVSGLPYWIEQVALLVRHARGKVREPFVARRDHAAVVREARILLAIYAAIGIIAVAAASTAPLTYWLLPVMLGQPFLRLYLLAEHTGCPFVPDMLENSRTTLTPAPVRFLVWNMSFHAEHHACPAVPFHRLPTAHQRLAGRLGHVTPGYIAAQREILETLG